MAELAHLCESVLWHRLITRQLASQQLASDAPPVACHRDADASCHPWQAGLRALATACSLIAHEQTPRGSGIAREHNLTEVLTESH